MKTLLYALALLNPFRVIKLGIYYIIFNVIVFAITMYSWYG